MLIFERDADRGGRPRLRYYSHTSNGRPIFGAKREATPFSGQTLESVLRQLKQLRPGWEFGTISPDQRPPRVKRAAA
jgi:hypothetical protein